MGVTATEPAVEAVCDALLRYSGRFADALRRVGDPAAHAIGRWNIAETAVHVSQSAPYFLGAARGQVELEDLDNNAALSVRAVDDEPERDLRTLAGRIVHGEQDLVAYARAAAGDPPVAPFRGLTVPLSSMLGIELGELLVHGHDVTSAAGLPWAIGPADAALALAGGLTVLPLLLDRRKAARLRLRCEPNQRIPDPSITSGRLCGRAGFPGQPCRAPSTSARASEAAPEFASTAVPPAKSRATAGPPGRDGMRPLSRLVSSGAGLALSRVEKHVRGQ